MNINNKMKVLFLGDSITKQGGRKNGFISKLKESVKDVYPGTQLVNAGKNGDTVKGLLKRSTKRVRKVDPDVVYVMIGVNDVWNKFSGAESVSRFVHDFESLLRALKGFTKHVVVITPTIIGEGENDHDDMMDDHAEMEKTIARAHKLDVIDAHDLFQRYLRFHPSKSKGKVKRGVLTTDGVHLNELGNDLIYHAIWDHMSI